MFAEGWKAVALVSFFLLAGFSASCFADVTVIDKRVIIDTSRYRAEFMGALMTSFTNKLVGGVEMMSAPDGSEPLLLLRVASPPGNDLVKRAEEAESVYKDGNAAVIIYKSDSP